MAESKQPFARRGMRRPVLREKEHAWEEDPPRAAVPRPAPILTADEWFTGEIWDLNPHKGFGFIRMAGTAMDYFFHLSSLPEGAESFVLLRKGQPVRFQAIGSAKGPRATRVELIA